MPPGRPTEQRLRPIQLRRSPTGQQATPSPQEEPAPEERQWLLCSACTSRVTPQDQAVSVNGRHGHAFFNPAGIAFEIRCFQTAPGTVPQDRPSTDFTWFPGYSWQIVLCGTCRTHLGWRFAGEGAAHAFFGLIASRLIDP